MNISKASRWATFAILASALLPLSRADAQKHDPRRLGETLEMIREAHSLPGMAVAGFVGGKQVVLGAVGVRRAGDATPATAEDRWQVGSCTMSLTATVAAMLAEDGRLQWDLTIGTAFPELRDTMEPAWAEVTLLHLLSHRGGAAAEPPPNVWRNACRAIGPAPSQRMEFVNGLLIRQPEAAKGATFIFSPSGYGIAGAMIERTAGEAWETLVQRRIFEPLLMSSAGFGGPGLAGKVDQPWGHLRKDGVAVPVPPGRAEDQPAAIAPAAGLRCSAGDLARYAAWHARAGRTTARLLGPASFRALHTPPREDAEYAMGWNVTADPRAGGSALWHHGKSALWHSHIWIAPAKDAAFVALTNVAGADAENACAEAIAAMVERFLAGDQ